MVVNRGPEAAGAAGIFLALSWIFVSLRCYCKIAITRFFGPEDYLCVITQVLFTLYCTCVLLGVRYGTGRHVADIFPPTDVPEGLKWWWFCEQWYCLAAITLKFSIGIFLLRIAIHKSQKIHLWIVMIVSAVMGTFFFLLFLFQCSPVSFFWAQYTGMKGSCINSDIIIRTAYVYSAISCWSDWTFCILPAFMVWNLQMNPRTKGSVLVLFALGALASATTIIRFPYLHTLTNKADFLYATTNVGILSTCEIGIAIVTSSAATLRPLFRRFLGRTQPGSSNIELSRPWPSHPGRSGYMRNREGGMGSRADDKGTTVTSTEAGLEEEGMAWSRGGDAERKWHKGNQDETSSTENVLDEDQKRTIKTAADPVWKS